MNKLTKAQEKRLIKEISIALDSPGKWKKNKVNRILTAVADELARERKLRCTCVFKHKGRKTILVEICKFHADELARVREKILKEVTSQHIKIDENQ